MFRHQQRLEVVYQARELAEMGAIERIGRADRQSHAVQAQRVSIAYATQYPRKRAAGREVILAVRFEPTDTRLPFEHVGMMYRAQTDARCKRSQRDGS